jgi:hypothetical protein
LGQVVEAEVVVRVEEVVVVRVEEEVVVVQVKKDVDDPTRFRLLPWQTSFENRLS